MSKILIIAEAGVNHNNNLEIAYKMIDVALKSGANAIKFQTWKSGKNLVSEEADKAEYQKNTTDENESQLDMIEKLTMSYNDFKKIYQRCNKKGIEFISTPFDLESVDFLNELGVNMFKVGSGDLTNYLLLKKVALTGKKMIVSTGMSNLEEVKNAINFIKSYTNSEIVVLHCVSCYPTNNSELNLNCIKTMKNELNLEIGFSDHTTGNKASVYSVCLGAKYIEKHFTLDKNLPGPDHKASLNPEELNKFVKEIRECEEMLGSYEKKCQKREVEVRNVVRRSLAINKSMKKGDIIKEEDLMSLRPYKSEICVSKYENFVGKILTRNINKYEFLNKR